MTFQSNNRNVNRGFVVTGYGKGQLPVAGPGYTVLDKPCLVSNEVQVAPPPPQAARPQNPSAAAPAAQLNNPGKGLASPNPRR